MIWRAISDLLLRARMLYWRLVYRGYRDRYEVAPAFRFNGSGILLYGDGRIVLGADSYIGELSTLQAVSGGVLRVGERCSLSHNVRIYTSTASADSDFRIGKVANTQGDVLIGDGAWIGANVFIGPGISIGADSVVGANSVVTRSIPASEIWGGVPARHVRRKQRPEGSDA